MPVSKLLFYLTNMQTKVHWRIWQQFKYINEILQMQAHSPLTDDIHLSRKDTWAKQGN